MQSDKKQMVTKLLIGAALVAYWVAPVDLAPGTPIDDLIITAVTLLGTKRALPRG